ncbi:putative dehydrogenase [Amaricoccus macauensis]|uniref:Putative dehydrogenase n=1 Tax=Amaricoccus macauensis TaxID=57001 RepID=A0A840SRJ9_9RHOB|nr:Gfo/Idh/MocA family oxidoreductase [Amaricoccus macauensis]MBB5223148.1 putative dehydrogenase [Amaricoccus macauensis]
MIRYAVVGAGWISQEAFLPGAAQSGNSRVAAIVTGDVGKAGRLASFHGIPDVVSYADYDALLASDRIDAVYVALPNSMHADYAIRAAKAGKHVMVEKPLACTLDEAEAMIAAARDGGVFLMTAYRLHNEPGTLALLEKVRSGAIGRPLFFQSVFGFQSAPGNHRLKAEHWGGPLQDLGVYCVNAARHVFAEEPVEAIAVRHQPADDPRFAEIEATVAATLRFPSGGIAQFIVSFGAAPIDAYRVVGTEGDIELDPGYRFETATRMRLRRDGRVEETPFERVDQFGGQIAYFSDCIVRGEPPVADGGEGLADMRALLAIEEAALTGRPVAIGTPARSRYASADMARSCPVTDHRLLI